MGVGNVVESTLSAIRRHPHPRLPVGRLKSRKYKKSAFGGKKSPAVAGTKTAISGEPVSSSNSVGVAFPQPRVAGEDRYPGYQPHEHGNSVGVAISRRRYPQQDNGLK